MSHVAVRGARRDEQRHADEADEHADAGLQPDLLVAAEESDERRPERRGRDEQRGHSARHPLLRPDHREIADADEQDADDHRMHPDARRRAEAFARAWLRSPQHEAGDGEAKSGHQQRRHRLDGDADGEIRRSPDEADDGECDVGEGAFASSCRISEDDAADLFAVRLHDDRGARRERQRRRCELLRRSC